jgi:hypothetical protein
MTAAKTEGGGHSGGLHDEKSGGLKNGYRVGCQGYRAETVFGPRWEIEKSFKFSFKGMRLKSKF